MSALPSWPSAKLVSRSGTSCTVFYVCGFVKECSGDPRFSGHFLPFSYFFCALSRRKALPG